MFHWVSSEFGRNAECPIVIVPWVLRCPIIYFLLVLDTVSKDKADGFRYVIFGPAGDAKYGCRNVFPRIFPKVEISERGQNCNFLL